MRARLPISASRLSSALAPAETPITAIRPPRGERAAGSRACWARRRARGSRRTARARRSPRARSPRAPSCATCSRSSSLRTVAVTRAPAARASWIAAVPTPPAPPCTSSRSPGRSSPWVKSASCAVVNTSGSPPAAGQSRPLGHGHQHALVRRSHSSAWAPPPTIAITRSPTAKRSAPGAERGDLAGELHPGDVLRRAGRRRVQPAPLHHVGAVEPGGAHPHEHLAGARLRIGMLLDRRSPSRGSSLRASRAKPIAHAHVWALSAGRGAAGAPAADASGPMPQDSAAAGLDAWT